MGTDIHLPLKNVCDMLSRSTQGFAFFFFISAFCVGFVVFGTSQQSLKGLLEECSCCARRRQQEEQAETSEAAAAGDIESRVSDGMGARRSTSKPNMIVDDKGHAVLVEEVSPADRIKGKCALFVLYMTIIVLIVTIFTFVPFLGNRSDLGERSYTTSRGASWKEACASFNERELDKWGLS